MRNLHKIQGTQRWDSVLLFACLKSVKVLRITYSPSQHYYCIFLAQALYCELSVDATCNYISGEF